MVAGEIVACPFAGPLSWSVSLNDLVVAKVDDCPGEKEDVDVDVDVDDKFLWGVAPITDTSYLSSGVCNNIFLLPLPLFFHPFGV